MNLKWMSDTELHLATVQAAEQERESAVRFLNHLIEVKRRHLFSRFKGGTLYHYCIQELKMSNGDAWRKINSAELLSQQPEIESKLQSGELNQTHLAIAAEFFKTEQTSEEDRPQIMAELSNTSTTEAKDKLIAKSKKPEKHLREKRRQKTKDLTELTLYVDRETIADLERLQEIWSHAIPKGEFGKIIARAAKEAVAKNDPFKRAEATEARKAKAQTRRAHAKANADRTKSPPAPGETAAQGLSASAMIERSPSAPAGLTKAEVKRRVWLRDEAQCTYVDPKTNECCGSRHFIEEDHIVAIAMGGIYSVENLRLRCRAHNQRHAIDCYGLTKMRRFVRQPGREYKHIPNPQTQRPPGSASAPLRPVSTH